MLKSETSPLSPSTLQIFQTISFRPNPESNANFISKMFFTWINSLLNLGQKKYLEASDLFDVPDSQKLKNVLEQSKKIEREEEKQKKSNKKKIVEAVIEIQELAEKNNDKEKSVNSLIFKISKFNFRLALLLIAMATVLQFAGPLCLNQILLFLSDKNAEAYVGFMWATIMTVLFLIRNVCQQQAYYWIGVSALSSQNLLYGKLYEKILTISSAAKKYQDTGKLMNLINIDVNAIYMYLQMSFFLVSSPIILVISIVLIIIEVQWAGAIGIFILFIGFYIQAKTQNVVLKYRKEMLKYTDQRSKAINEFISGIKIIKYYGWEKLVISRIEKIRNHEASTIYRQSLLRGVIDLISTFFPLVISVVVFAIYASNEGASFQASKAYTVLTLFNMVQVPLRLLGFIIMNYTNSRAAIKRIDHFLKAEDRNEAAAIQDSSLPKGSIEIIDGNFAWDTKFSTYHFQQEKHLLDKRKKEEKKVLQVKVKDITNKYKPHSSELNNDQKGFIPNEKLLILSEINFSAKSGQLIAVVGRVGTGKSSFAHALLGEMTKTKGIVRLNGKISYVPQTAWLMNNTLRENVVFNNTFESEKYNETINICELNADLEQLPGGDQTEIGERGINLSGGQKQRISLARAVYEDSEIYIIDDVLSALDAHVGKNIYHNVIRKKLRNKTVVFVTHALHYVKEADKILVFKDGVIAEKGTFKELTEDKNSEFNDLHVQYKKKKEKELQDKVGKEKEKKLLIDSPAIKQNLNENDKMRQGALLKTEERSLGSVPFKIYKFYISAGGTMITITTIVMFIFAQVARILNDWWLSIWSQNKYFWEIGDYVGVYMGLAVVGSLLVFLRTAVFARFSLNTAMSMQRKLIKALMKSPMGWFDMTPTGRILSRTSKDQDSIDLNLPLSMQFCIVNILIVVGAIILSSTITPLFLAFLSVELIVYIYLIKKYLKSSREIKRIELNARTPVNSHFGETNNGLYIIRAAHKQALFFESFVAKSDQFSRAVQNNFYTTVWIGLRSDIFGSTLIGASVFFAALSKYFGALDDPGLMGLSISWLLQISQMLTFVIKLLGDTENYMNSVQRINGYIEENPSERNLNLEKPMEKEMDSWPSRGAIKCINLEYKYREGLESVIKNISFDIHSHEKVGVVGRTGSGKSTLTLGLLRILELANEPEGKIIIDGKLAGELDLHCLRRNITMIPQDPVLFSGSLRSNIDPFDEYKDEDIIEGLKKVQIWEGLKDGENQEFASDSEKLYMKILDGGSNFSLGQKQLICICRAIIRKSKILLMDEATASIDEKTDHLIQKMIKKEFKDTTVITIAHRLNTIIQYDRIMVLDKGTIVEFDTPLNLLERDDSFFANLINEQGKEFREKMIHFAKNKNMDLESFENEHNEKENLGLENFKNLEGQGEKLNLTLDSLIEIPSERKDFILIHHSKEKRPQKIKENPKHKKVWEEEERESKSIYEEMEEKEFFPLLPNLND